MRGAIAGDMIGSRFEAPWNKVETTDSERIGKAR